MRKVIGIYDALMSLRPDDAWVAHDNSFDWHEDATLSPTADEVNAEITRLQQIEDRRAAVEDIESKRDTALTTGVTWNGKNWYTDEVFQGQLTSRVAAWSAGILDPTVTKPVRAMDGSINQLTFDDHKTLAAAVMDYVEQVWGQSWQEKAAL